MEDLIWASIAWAAVLILIPFHRIAQLWPVAVISLVWNFIYNYIFVHLGYYEFPKGIAMIAGIPAFDVIGGIAGGLLVINWLPRKALYKVAYIAAFSGLLSVLEYFLISRGAFRFLNGFDPFLSYFQEFAGLTVLVWLCIAVLGEVIYEGTKTRFIK